MLEHDWGKLQNKHQLTKNNNILLLLCQCPIAHKSIAFIFYFFETKCKL
jgi:hypothetical protein